MHIAGEVARAFCLIQQSAEVEYRGLGLDQFCVTDDVGQSLVAHLGEVLAHLLSEEREVVHEMLISAEEMLT